MMIRGSKFSEPFNFTDPQGRPSNIAGLEFELVVRYNTFIRKYTVGNGLVRSSSTVTWVLDSQQTMEYKFDNVFYTLYLVTDAGKQEIKRGVMEVA